MVSRFVVCFLLVLPLVRAETKWVDANELTIEGRGWGDISGYNRLPDRGKAVVPRSVWNLSRQSAGISIRFQTNAKAVQVKWDVTSANLAMPHMPATGVSGVDIYVKGKSGTWRYMKNGRPKGLKNSVSAPEGSGEMRE